MSTILWVDNDPAYIRPYLKALQDRGDRVNVVTTAIEAESALDNQSYDLVILDVMIPTKTAEEEDLYNPEETDHGHKTGLIFYRRNKERMVQMRTRILVLTVRLDKLILEEFVNEGLPRECFRTKIDLRKVEVFVERISVLLGAANG